MSIKRYGQVGDYVMESKNGEFVTYSDHVEALEKATAPKLPGDLIEFEELVKSHNHWWNSKQGTTCEMAIGYDDIQAKMEILGKYSERLDDGVWTVHHCDTCKGHTNGTRTLHAMIWQSSYPKQP